MALDITEIEYKQQAIVGSNNAILGYEILASKVKFNGKDKEFKYIKTSEWELVSNNLVSILENTFSIPLKWIDKNIFINLERGNICNSEIIKKLINISRKFNLNKINLVVEVTERNSNHCNYKYINNILHLQSEGVYLALDDFDFISGDFRDCERNVVEYNFIKIIKPKFISEIDLINEIDLKGGKLIIERIEQIKYLSKITKPVWGLQGYLFDKGERVPL